MKLGDKVQVYFSTLKKEKTKQGIVSEIINWKVTPCIRLEGSNVPYAISCVDLIN